MKTLDIARLRADTPACEKLIHFNNAGASLMPEPVYRAVLDHLALEQRVGGYAAEGDATPVLEDFYDAFAALLNCDRAEIAYVENEQEFWFALGMLRILCLPRPRPFGAAEKAEFERALRLSAELLAKRGKLPEGLDARRPIP